MSDYRNVVSNITTEKSIFAWPQLGKRSACWQMISGFEINSHINSICNFHRFDNSSSESENRGYVVGYNFLSRARFLSFEIGPNSFLSSFRILFLPFVFFQRKQVVVFETSSMKSYVSEAAFLCLNACPTSFLRPRATNDDSSDWFDMVYTSSFEKWLVGCYSELFTVKTVDFFAKVLLTAHVPQL